MPNLNETAAELEQMFVAGWGATTPIAYDNVKFTETQDTPYVTLIFMPFTSENVALGSILTGSKRERHTGLMTILVNTPIDQGSGLAYSYADTIRGFMDNQNPVANLYTYASNVRRSGAAKDGWFSLIIDVSFTSDDTIT